MVFAAEDIFNDGGMPGFEDEEALKKMMEPKLQTQIYPESVIVLHTTDQFLKRRSKTLMMNNVQDALKW